MKKKSIGMIILRNFLKTLGVMLLFVVVGVLSYYLTMLYYNKTGRTERSTQYTHAITVNTGNESSNLIYSYDEKTKKIKAVVLELFDESFLCDDSCQYPDHYIDRYLQRSDQSQPEIAAGGKTVRYK